MCLNYSVSTLCERGYQQWNKNSRLGRKGFVNRHGYHSDSGYWAMKKYEADDHILITHSMKRKANITILVTIIHLTNTVFYFSHDHSDNVFYLFFSSCNVVMINSSSYSTWDMRGDAAQQVSRSLDQPTVPVPRWFVSCA